MNNLLLSALLFVSASLVFLAERFSLQSVNSNNRRLADQAASLRRSIERTDASVLSLRRKLEERRTNLKELRSNLAAESSTAGAIPLEPDKEGLWPKAKPYFYVPKKYLPGAWLAWFKGFHLHPDAEVLLGMTPAEAVAVDDAFCSIVERLRACEAEHLMPSNDDVSPHGKGGNASYRLPTLQQEMQPFRDEFQASIRGLLGPTRFEIFNRWAESCFKASLNDLGAHARLFSFTGEFWTGEGETGTRLVVREDGKEQTESYELWDTPQDSGLPEEQRSEFKYRHLFGENGRKRPDEPASK